MSMGNGIDKLQSLLGVNALGPATVTTTKYTPQQASALGDDKAVLSGAAAEVSRMTVNLDVRADKVSSIRAALMAGTYEVAPSAVASTVIDAMLNKD